MAINKFLKAQIKRTAMNVYPLVRRKKKLEETIVNAKAEMETIQAQIDANETAIKAATGYSTEDLVIRVVTPTGKFDKDGHEIKTTKWEFKYPETIIPPVEIEHDGEHHLVDEEGHELPIMTEDVFDPTESVNFDGNNPNMI